MPQYHLVTAKLTSRARFPGEHPEQGMVKKADFQSQLHEIHPIIVAPDMRQFMQKQNLHLSGRQLQQHPNREQNHRFPAAHGEGFGNKWRFQELNFCVYVQAFSPLITKILKRLGSGAYLPTTQALRQPPAAQEAQPQQSGAKQPSPTNLRCMTFQPKRGALPQTQRDRLSRQQEV